MKEAAVEAWLDPSRAHPHALRHTYGRTAVLNGVPTPVLQSWLGHRSLAETERYPWSVRPDTLSMPLGHWSTSYPCSTTTSPHQHSNASLLPSLDLRLYQSAAVSI